MSKRISLLGSTGSIGRQTLDVIDACGMEVAAITANSSVDRLEEQARRCCESVGAILAEAGLGFENVVKTTCFLADMADFAAFNAVYAEYFTGKPARSCVAARELPKKLLCEIEVIAEYR